MKIIKVEEIRLDAYGLNSVDRVRSQNSGEEFRTVNVQTEDGKWQTVFKSNVRDGFYIQVFVPWDSVKHGQILIKKETINQ